jgi:hypothetical protein
MNGAANFACAHVRAAFRLERARVAVVLFREVEERAGLRQAVARLEKSRWYFFSSLPPGQT